MGRRLLGICLVCCCGLFAAAADTPDPLALGKSLPATFHPFNINVAAPPADPVVEDPSAPKPRYKAPPYSTKHKYHCLISEYDLDPTVMLLVRGLEASDTLKDLLQKLDAAIDRNRRVVRLRAFVVFIDEDMKSLTTEDDRREANAKTLDRLVEDLKLKNVVVALAAKPDLAKFRLDDTHALTAVLYNKLRIVAVHRLPADSTATKPILDDVASKLGAPK
ncbi:MAG: hypothetical protein U0840_30425 [Gemmataceae bacterium]